MNLNRRDLAMRVAQMLYIALRKTELEMTREVERR